MTSWIKVGQKVVCIKDKWIEALACDICPSIRQVYTIRSIVTDPNDPRIGLRFKEIINPPAPRSDGGIHECSFNAEAFRPVKKTSIEVFHKILRDVESEIPAQIEP